MGRWQKTANSSCFGKDCSFVACGYVTNVCKNQKQVQHILELYGAYLLTRINFKPIIGTCLIKCGVKLTIFSRTSMNPLKFGNR